MGSKDFKIIALLLAMALAVGGAGVSFPLLGAMLQLSALGVAAYLVLTPRKWRFDRLASGALIVAGLMVLLPVIQLLPLPSAVWEQLPGREVPAQIDALLGITASRPLTLDFAATVRSALTLLPAVIIFIGCMFLQVSERHRLLWIALGFAVVSAVLGVVQLSTGGRFTPYPSTHSGFPIGLFVNRNHNASLLLAAIPIAGALGAVALRRRVARLPVILGTLSLMVVFAVVVVGTTSRMALVLLPLSLLAGLLLLLSRQSALRIALPSILGLAGVGWLLLATGQFNRTLIRFSSLHDPRFDFWTDIQWALDKYGLAGTGFGTFVPVYQSAQSLEAVGPAVTNHAHNDYLEVLLDGGIPAILILLMVLSVLAVAAFRHMKSDAPVSRSLLVSGAAISIAMLMLFSFVDYPLRMPALAALFAVLCSVVLPSNPAAEPSREHRSGGVAGAAPWRGKLLRGGAAGLLLLLAAVSVQAGLSARQVQKGHYVSAAQWAPWSTRAHEARATEALLQNDLAAARNSASAALRLSPINAAAIRTLALVELTGGDRSKGERLMGIGSALSWRDPLIQVWVMQAAQAGGESDKVVQRATALFRQHIFLPPVIAALITAPREQGISDRLIVELSKAPDWRIGFLRSAGEMPSRDAAELAYIVRGLSRTPAPVTLREMKPVLDAWLENGEVALAQRMWRMILGDRLIANGEFDELPREGTQVPRYWSVPENGPNRLAVAVPSFAANGRALRMEGGGSTISQRLLLSPGRYVLSFRAQTGQPGGFLRVELDCRGGPSQVHKLALPTGEQWSEGQIAINVPDRDCPSQRLAIDYQAGNATPLWLDNIRIQSTAR